MPGFANMNGVAVGSNGKADPQSQLFRSSAIGVETGPFISQVQCSSLFMMGLFLRTSSPPLNSLFQYYIASLVAVGVVIP